jgi:hypothetical protein
VKRRNDVVGIFPNPAALLRLSACVLIEAHDEWQDQDRRYLSEESMALLNPPAPTRPGSEEDHPDPDLTKGDRRYGIVDITREATRDELHHVKGRDRG